MYTRILIFLALALAVCVPIGRAQSCGGDESNCFTFTPQATSFTYTFGDGSSLQVSFDTVLHSFDLRVSVSNPVDSSAPPCDSEVCPPQINLDSAEFPTGTRCVTYPANSPGECDQYDFTGHSNFSSGPNGVPVKNVDYKGLITLVLTYSTSTDFVVHTPAFGHAPGDTTQFTENILTFYSDPAAPQPCASCETDPGMGGKTPGLSSVVALDIPIATPETVCTLNVTPVKSSSGQNPLVEVSFQLSASGCFPAIPVKDKTATLSVASVSAGSHTFLSFATLVNGGDSNKFHWDGQSKFNVQDVNTNGLPDGTYAVTVISKNFSPVTGFFCVSGGNPISCF